MIYCVRNMDEAGVKCGDNPYLFIADSDSNKAYMAKLKETISGVLDESMPFVQVEDKKKCKYCSFTEFCRR